MNQEVKLKDEERTRCDQYCRVMGYFQRKQNFNIGKQGEFEERKYFKESKIMDRINAGTF